MTPTKVNSLDGSLFFVKKLKILYFNHPPYLQIVTIIIIVEVIVMRKIIENTGFWLSTALCVLLFAVLIAQLFGIHRYIVVSGSMEPSLYAGDIVFVNSNVEFENVKIGDVIIFKYKDMNIIHRVVDEVLIDDKKHLKTKGDNNDHDDGYLTTEENFCGVAIGQIPKIGILINKNQIERKK